ncbi:MAG: hypothetical protein HY900_34575 [Deltaproteobacteria bacterium]|nr:hypothetical protein [Deltaproteobacteria bacterium]
MANHNRPYFTVYYQDDERRLNVTTIGDRVLLDGDPKYGCSIVLLSVLGPHSAVRGLLAALVSHRDVRSDLYPSARLYGSDNGRIVTHALSKELTHGAYLAPEILNGTESRRIAILNDTPEKVFERLMHRFAVPAVPEWKDWLCQALKRSEQLTTLTGHGVGGCMISTSEESLDALISKGVAEGQIRF